jgi:hypothetical protein
MDIFSKDELRTLVDEQTPGCLSVSLYMSTQRPGSAEVQQNPVRLKKLLREAQERLVSAGLKKTEAEAYLQNASTLLEDSFFWMDMSDGLAIFLSRDSFRYYKLPAQFPDLAVVANRFHVKPLLPLLATDGRFYVLAMSQNAVRLLQCSRYSFNEVDITGKVPRSLSEALRFDENDNTAQFHFHTTAPGENAGMVTGHHGPEVLDSKENLQRFFFLVDRGLQREFLHNETAPLVIFSVDYLFPIYKKANTYKNLIDKEIEGNPDKVSPSELHRRGATVVEPYFKKRQAEVLTLYQQIAGHGRTTNDLESVVSGSYQGRVSVLFIADKMQQWGRYDPASNKVETHDKEESCDVDLIDFAAAQTLAHRGEVYAVDTDKVPYGAPVAAVLRY